MLRDSPRANQVSALQFFDPRRQMSRLDNKLADAAHSDQLMFSWREGSEETLHAHWCSLRTTQPNKRSERQRQQGSSSTRQNFDDLFGLKLKVYLYVYVFFIQISVSSWCSGYHVCFTRSRSPVRTRPSTLFLFAHTNRLAACRLRKHQTICFFQHE